MAQGNVPTKSHASLLEHAVVPGTPESRVCVGLLLRADLTTGLRGGKGAAACRESRQSMGVGSELAHPLQSTYRCMRLFTLWICLGVGRGQVGVGQGGSLHL